MKGAPSKRRFLQQDDCPSGLMRRCYPGELIDALRKRMPAEITSSKWHSCNSESMKNDIPVLGFKSQMEERLLKDASAGLGGGTYDKRLPCFGWGIGWFSFLVGFIFPPMWFYATILYFRSYYRKDLRERLGLQASAFAALIFSVVAVIIAVLVVISYSGKHHG